MDPQIPNPETSPINNNLPQQQNITKKLSKKIILIIALVVLVLVTLTAVTHYLVTRNGEEVPPNKDISVSPSPAISPQATPSSSQISLPIPLDRTEALLSDVDFQSTPIPYPQDWPADIQYPSEIVLIEALSGSIENSPKIWSSKFISENGLEETAVILSEYFTSSGWDVERLVNDPKGIILSVERNNKESTGSVVLGPEDNSHTKILSTIRLSTSQ